LYASNGSKNNRDRSKSNGKNWFGELWDEFIEFSTYGPAERKVLKARRMAAATEAAEAKVKMGTKQQEEQVYVDVLRRRVETIDERKRKRQLEGTTREDSDDLGSLSVQAFQNATAAAGKTVTRRTTYEREGSEFDGYQLRDLLVSKFGVPLDVDFQRGFFPSSSQSNGQLPCVYCTVLPHVGFGSRTKSRHISELDYLMHLQAVVEILNKYDNLQHFVSFIETTTKVPKPGTESLPFRMKLNHEQLKKVLGL
jgi:hypothetical protein